MPSQQLEPKIPDNGFPKWRRWAEKLHAWIRGQQLLDGEGYSVVDVPGGGGKYLVFDEENTSFIASLIRNPFQLISTTNELGEKVVWVKTSTINGHLPEDFNVMDDPPHLITPGSGGAVYAKVTIEIDEEEQTAVDVAWEIVDLADEPPESETEFYSLLGGYDFDVETDILATSNVAFGPLDILICVDWTQDPPVIAVTFYHG